MKPYTVNDLFDDMTAFIIEQEQRAETMHRSTDPATQMRAHAVDAAARDLKRRLINIRRAEGLTNE